MQTEGRIDDVFLDDVGSTAYEALIPGMTTIKVDAAGEFDEDGGQLIIGSNVYSYTAIDESNEDYDILFLSSPLTLGCAEGDVVNVYPMVSLLRATVAQGSDYSGLTPDELDDDDPGEYLEVGFTHELQAAISEGSREDLIGEYVILDDESGEWEITRIIGRETKIQSSALVGPIPEEAKTDGLPPTSSPIPEVLSFMKVLIVRIPPISNPDLVSYEVHVSKDQWFTPTPDTLAGVTSGSQLYARGTPAGQLEYDTDYYVRIVARDADGAAAPSDPVLGAASRIGLEDIIAGSITAELLESVLVLVTTIKAGEFIEISSASTDDEGNPVGGIIVHDPANPTGTPLVHLHPSGCRFKGELTTDLLTVLKEAQIVNLFQLGTGSKTTLQNGVPDPTQKPSAAHGPEGVGTWPVAPSGWGQRGLFWDETDSTWLRLLWNPTDKRMAIQKVSPGGDVTSFINTAEGMDFVSEISSVCRIGSGYFITLLETFAGGQKQWRIARYTSSGSRTHVATLANESSISGHPAVGVDETTNQLIGVVTSASNNNLVGVYRFSTAVAYLEQAMTVTRAGGAPWLMNLRSVAIRSFDFGSSYFWFSAGTANMFAPFSGWAAVGDPVPNVAEDASKRFDIDASVLRGGSAWRSPNSRFYSISDDTQIRRWSDYKPNADQTWTFRYADKSSSGGTTAGSPAETLVVPARRTVTVTLPPAPNGVSSADIWVGYAASGEAATLYKRSESLGSSRSMVLSGKSTTGSNVIPTTNTMGGTPAVFQSEVGGFIVKGTGEGSWPLLEQVKDSGWVEMSLASGWSPFNNTAFNVRPAYRRIGKQVFLRGMITNSSAAANSTMFTLPAEVRPSKNLLVPCVVQLRSTNSATAGGTAHTHTLDNATTRLTIGSDGTVAAASANSGWVSVEGITFLLD